jgi:indolepyruvate ferredoxin oxidoreductase alpha subunit
MMPEQTSEMTEPLARGSHALAYGAIDAQVQVVSGYPGSPSTAVFEALVAFACPELQIEWAVNEKSAFDIAFGASLAGMRSLVCLKSVGLNVALDSLMVGNLSPGPGGFVVLVGDDPGGWGSQNEQDSRVLIAAAEIPLLEPRSAEEARNVMHRAYELSEQHEIPVAVRVTRALIQEQVPEAKPEPQMLAGRSPRLQGRHNVLPVDVVAYHRRLQEKNRVVASRFETLPWNNAIGSGYKGVVTAGHASRKLQQVLERSGTAPLQCLNLSTLHPLPERRITGYLSGLNEALVLEETAPFLEIQVRAIAQGAGLCLPILGRLTGHLPGSGELSSQEIAGALRGLVPEWPWPTFASPVRNMPSRKALCEDCPYVPALEALLDLMDRHGGREAFVVTGETGCMVRAQLPPWEILDVKYGMGSSIGLGAGLAMTGMQKRIVALSGDSALLHSGLGELIDACQAGVQMLVLVLANETTALSGGQPHPGTPHNARGYARSPLRLGPLIQAAGVRTLCTVDPKDRSRTLEAMEQGLLSDGLSVVIVERACPIWAA